jgi:hypothetical protein
MPTQQFNYGQKYGDWRNYAGYTDKETGEYNFGADPTKVKVGIPPPPKPVLTEEGSAPFIPPSISMSPLGLKPFDVNSTTPNYFNNKQSVFDQFSSHIGD